MQGFRPRGNLQRFANVLSAVRNPCVPPRSYRSALAIHLDRLNAPAEWKTAGGVPV